MSEIGMWELRTLMDDLVASLSRLGLPVREPAASTGPVAGCGLVVSFPLRGSLPEGVIVYWCAGDGGGDGHQISGVIETIMNDALAKVVTEMGYPTRRVAGPDGLGVISGGRFHQRATVAAEAVGSGGEHRGHFVAGPVAVNCPEPAAGASSRAGGRRR